MPSCVVPGCRNSSMKKFKMNSLPRNPVQRALWIKNIDRPNWVPTDNAVVCEVHFAPEMWEKIRVDGTRKLKCNAVPTIFNNGVVKESPIFHTTIPPEKNQNNTNVLFSNKQTVIKILPPENQLNLQQTPSVIPTLSTSTSVNSKSLLNNNNCKSISILKPKMVSIKPLILANTRILKNERITNGVQKKIIISRSSDSSEAKSIDLSHSLPMNDINVPDITEVKTDSSQSVLNSETVNQVININGSTPITNIRATDISKTGGNPSMLISMIVDTSNNTSCSNTEATNLRGSLPSTKVIPMAVDSVNLKPESKKLTEQSTISENFKSENQQKSERFISSGIILNKAEAKKIEDERFEKMDKLLLKQLKLNDALRKKLAVLRSRIHRLMKKQDEKQNCEPVLFLRKVFTDDQIRVIQLRHLNENSKTAWSDDTMLKAIKLKKACGLRGYEEILNQNLPYPCIKTINRWCIERHIEIP